MKKSESITKLASPRYPKYQDGNKFGQWTILERVNKRKVLCECSCGTIKEQYTSNLGSGKSKSCGCSRRNKANGTKLYNVWSSMKSRCLNENHHAYEDYGGRGITICKEWEDDVDSFYEWSLNNGYKEGLTIDRIDNEKGYSPDNCRWSTMVEQHNNKRNNLLIEYEGETKTVAQWSRKFGINNRTILSRIRAGWDVNDLFIEVGGDRDETIGKY